MSAKRGPEPPVYIDNDRALEKLVLHLQDQRAIAVDTESNPLFAYREKLCLIQISTAKRDYIVDPLSGLSLEPLVSVFADPNVVKILHDAEYDILMLKRTLPVEFVGLFDTKVAATSLAMESLGLAAILKEFFDVSLNKKMQRSDWGRRPLTEEQLDYARYDTRFLIPLANDFRTKLLDADPIHQLEVASEFRRVEQLAPEDKSFNPDDFILVKGSDRLNPVQARAMRELFVMRHQISDELDRPAFKVLPNAVLLDLARSRPETMQELVSEKILSPKLRDRRGADVLAALARARKRSPLPSETLHPTRKDQDLLTAEQSAVLDALRNWRKDAARERGVDASLILPRTTLFALCRLRHRPLDPASLRGCGVLEPWRVDYYGEGILRALNTLTPNSNRFRGKKHRQ